MGVVAQLVHVVDLVIPRAVVKVGVVVGNFVALHPVDRHAGAVGVGPGVVAGIDGLGAADDPETRGVVLDVGVAGGRGVLDEGVVGLYV